VGGWVGAEEGGPGGATVHFYMPGLTWLPGPTPVHVRLSFLHLGIVDPWYRPPQSCRRNTHPSCWDSARCVRVCMCARVAACLWPQPFGRARGCTVQLSGQSAAMRSTRRVAPLFLASSCAPLQARLRHGTTNHTIKIAMRGEETSTPLPPPKAADSRNGAVPSLWPTVPLHAYRDHFRRAAILLFVAIVCVGMCSVQ
jgi:hypothetical protein